MGIEKFYDCLLYDGDYITDKGSINSSNKQDFIKNKNYSTPFEDELALKHPLKFISMYVNPGVVSNSLINNPNIKEILLSNKLKLQYNIDNVNSIIMSHLIPTAKRAQSIYVNMGHKKSEINYTRLTQAALLHDIGKVFIPDEILNKKGKLNPKEREIIELHNKLSYEILKTTNLHPLVAKLAYEHHDYEHNLKKNQENQALTIADVYCALREKRVYKKPMNDLMAKFILYDMGAKGSIDTRYISCIT